jgi:hypothetical protein
MKKAAGNHFGPAPLKAHGPPGYSSNRYPLFPSPSLTCGPNLSDHVIHLLPPAKIPCVTSVRSNSSPLFNPLYSLPISSPCRAYLNPDFPSRSSPLFPCSNRRHANEIPCRSPQVPAALSVESGDTRRFRRLFWVLSDSTTPCASPCKFLQPRNLLCHRFRPYPKPHRRTANSSLLSLPPQEGPHDSVLRNLFSTPRRAPWTLSLMRTATGEQPPSTTEPSATAHEFFDDLTVNAGEPLSQICFHPLDLDPSVRNRSLNRRVMG